MPKRPHGDGSVRKRKDGRWEARVSLGYGPDGKRRRKSIIRHTQAEVVSEMRLLKAAIEANRVPSKKRKCERLRAGLARNQKARA